jgi:hypothetical protein
MKGGTKVEIEAPNGNKIIVTPIAPYTSFKSLLTEIERMHGAIPPRVDRSYLRGSEGQKTQLMAAMRYLGLITPTGEVTPTLTTLVNNEKERPRLIKELLIKHYPKAHALAATNGTQKQLQETFDGLQGDTLRKAITFYLKAAKYAGLTVSKNFSIPYGVSSARASGKKRPSGSARQVNGDSPSTPTDDDGDMKARYLDMLMKKAEASEKLDTELLDRIEALLGMANSGK